MTQQIIYVMLTMDCEPAKCDVTPYALTLSGSGAANYVESEQSIKGYADIARQYGFPLTLFVHPEVADAHATLLLDLRQHQDACLGLHLHPYKLRNRNYRHDLGAYSAGEQRQIISEAVDAWQGAMGFPPQYFRGGVFSANDNTIPILQELGFRGGSLSNPGRVLPEAYAIWAGAESYPHRAHLSFRQTAGESDFVEIPVSVAYGRPTASGERGEQGYEWPYIPAAKYAHAAVIEDILFRFARHQSPHSVIVTDTHNDMDYTDPEHHATRKLHTILDTIQSFCAAHNMQPVGITADRMCDRVISA